VLGNVTGGAGTISIAGAGTAGTFTLGGNLTLNGGTMSFDLAETPTVGGGVNDLAVVGNLTLTGTTSISINKLTGIVASSPYTLINYTGTLTETRATSLSPVRPVAPHGRLSRSIRQPHRVACSSMLPAIPRA
jgi:hypothetical protein